MFEEINHFFLQSPKFFSFIIENYGAVKVGKSVITISFFVEKVILARKHDTPVFVGKKNITFRGLKTWVNLTHVIYGDKPVLSLQ